MHRKRVCVIGSIIALVIAALVVAVSAAAAKPGFTAYASCGAKPGRHVKHCRFDRPEHARATIVFRSHVGKRDLRVCQKITGLSFHGRQCIKAKKPTAKEVIPFELKGAYRSFKVVVTFDVKSPGAGGPYARAARVALSFDP